MCTVADSPRRAQRHSGAFATENLCDGGICSYESEQQYEIQTDMPLPRVAQLIRGHGCKLVRQPASLSQMTFC